MGTRRTIKSAKLGSIIMSVALFLFGLFVTAENEISAEVICCMLGAVMTVYGIVKIAGYFSRDLYRLAFQYDLAFGTLTVITGVLMLVHPRGIISIFTVIVGIIVLADGLFKIQIALDSKRFGINEWWLIIAVAVVLAVFGLLLIIRPWESVRVMTVLLGVSMMLEGILSLCVSVYAIKIS